MRDQGTQEAKIAPAIAGSLALRSLAVAPILQYLFARPEGDFIEYMRLELGVAFRWGLWLNTLVADLVATGLLVRERSWGGVEPDCYKLAPSAWLALAREEQECQTQRRADCELSRA